MIFYEDKIFRNPGLWFWTLPEFPALSRKESPQNPFHSRLQSDKSWSQLWQSAVLGYECFRGIWSLTSNLYNYTAAHCLCLGVQKASFLSCIPTIPIPIPSHFRTSNHYWDFMHFWSSSGCHIYLSHFSVVINDRPCYINSAVDKVLYNSCVIHESWCDKDRLIYKFSQGAISGKEAGEFGVGVGKAME
jgi:hypothetical protein